MEPRHRSRSMSSDRAVTGSTSSLRASARTFAPRRPACASTSAASAAFESSVHALCHDLGALGVVTSDEEEDAEGEKGIPGNIERAYVEGDVSEAPVGEEFVLDDGAVEDDFDQGLAFLASAFPDYDWACLEEALMNTGGDVELAMELLMDDEIPEVAAPDVDDAEAFPSLGGSAPAKPVASQPEPLPKKIFISGGMSNVNRASVASMWSANTGAHAGTSARATKIERGAAEGTKTKIEWVETGAAVGNLYAANREDARDFARVRNVCYEQATNAYLSGNKALAKELSRQGREAAAKMSAAHEVAATSIYQSRGGGRDGMIDLHGLHVAEALNLLRRELSRLRSSGHSHAQVLVGTGHHTVGSRTPSRLPVAVETFLHEQRWSFSEPQSGLLQVRLN